MTVQTSHPSKAYLRTLPLDKNWCFKQSSNITPIAQTYTPVAQFPTVVHIDLLKNDLIPDPYVGTNELDCLWINDADWTYKTAFAPPEARKEDNVWIVFEGLDTAVDVYLDGEHLFFSKDMFIPRRVDVTGVCGRKRKEMQLVLKFRSPTRFAKEEEQRIGFKRAPTDNTMIGGHARMYLRKAQYHWGWDWGPALASTGPYLPIRLEIFAGRMDDVKILPKVHDSLDRADIKVSAKISGLEGKHVLVEVKAPSGGVVERNVFEVKGENFEGSITVTKPELWWPHTHGVQPRYEFTVELLSGDKSSLHRITKPLGLRHLKLLQHPLKSVSGTSFAFAINHTPIFSGGSNWIPGDFFLPRFTHPNSQVVDANYRRWLTLAKSGHQNMIRVWGGGIIETDHFYNLCDELGLLVWQDLLFACGNYPAHDEFCELVREETIVQVTRIVHHPSLVLVCGDSEDVWLAGLRGWEYKEEEKTVEEWMRGNFQHRRTLERVLPEALEVVGIGEVGLEYWESSPFGGKGANARDVGDTHVWDVWHGPMRPYQSYKDLMGRFVSEFGFESPPNIRTINRMLPNPTTRQSQSLPFLAHDKGPGAERRVTMYMGESFRFRMDPLGDYVYCAQLLQSEAIGFAVNTWRREFRGPGEENCSGALVWQLNDNWPGISWAIADYYLHPKPVFFAMKRALAPVSISSERIATKENLNILRGYPNHKSKVAFWACSSLLTGTAATLSLAAHDITSGEAAPVSRPTAPISTTIKPNCTTELVTIEVPFPTTTVVSATLRSPAGEVLARCVSWPDPLKFVTFAEDPQVLARIKDGRDEVLVKCAKPVKGLVLQVPLEEGDDAGWGDNCIDVVPGEEVRVPVQGLARRGVEGRWLCDWEGRGRMEVIRE